MMKTKIIKIAVVILILATLIFLINGIIQKASAIEVAQQARGILPNFKFKNLESIEFNKDSLNAVLPTVIIAFSPDCQFCQYEAKAIQENLEEFKRTNLLLVSHANKEETLRFGSAYGFLNQPNLYLVLNQENEFYQQFGERTFPTILIYDKGQKLTKIFKGETKISAILSILNRNRT